MTVKCNEPIQFGRIYRLYQDPKVGECYYFDSVECAILKLHDRFRKHEQC